MIMQDLAEYLVFVYGTLRSGLRLHSYLSHSRFVADAVISGEIYDLGHYPAYRPAESGAVQGEVWAVDDSILLRLDQVEGYDQNRDCGLYLRREVLATCANGSAMNVQVYVGNMNLLHAELINTGHVSDYKAWLDRK